MTHQTYIRSHNAAADAASLPNSLAALLARDDIVRPELRNAAILGAQHASRGKRHVARDHLTLASRS
ncbi:hypothetical protein [Halomonas sp. RA08-2]|uniref:hypothetical protein n=1 Tax=Halomonas sp. RA08-2 TaxID=3440842 RepID=UPI003EEAA5BD